MQESNTSLRFNSFLELSRSNKIVVALANGILLEKVAVDDKVYALFALSDFYVELILTASAISDIRAFNKHEKALDRYLGQIDLSDLSDLLQPKMK